MWQRIIVIALLLYSSVALQASQLAGQLNDSDQNKSSGLDEGLWAGAGAASSYSGSEASVDKQLSNSFGVSYQKAFNSDLALSSQVRYLNSTAKLDKENSSALLFSGLLKFYLNFQDIRLFVGPSLGSVYNTQSSGSLISPSFGINYGINFSMFGLRASVESQRAYIFDANQNSSSISELLFKLRIL